MTTPTGSKEEMEGVPELPCGAKIAASESGSPVDGRQPIETAPKGTAVIILVEDAFVGEAVLRDAGDSDDGWWWAGTGPGDYYAEKISPEPTHWMPLPLPPRDEPAACESSRDEPLPSREELERALREAADQFEFYEKGHRAKQTPEGYTKALVNRAWAERLRNLLAQGHDHG